MIQSLQHFLAMGGYAFYVWTAYGSVTLLLFLLWYTTWRASKHLTK